ncbi:MAG: pseudouridine synthase [Bacteroidales bacterium]
MKKDKRELNFNKKREPIEEKRERAPRGEGRGRAPRGGYKKEEGKGRIGSRRIEAGRRSEAGKREEEIRLNRFIANSGICSRREADKYIEAGLITVNGKVVTQMGAKVFPNDKVRYNGELLKGERDVYILMNKPKDFVTTLSDPYADKNVIDLIEGKCKERVFPVGRLDKKSTGVLLLTNDGELCNKLTHPSNNHRKIYSVTLDKELTQLNFNQILDGITLEDGFIKADALSFVDGERSVIGIEIHSGRNRIVRRIFEHFGHRVKHLDRVYFAGLTKRDLRRGSWRYLTDKEISMLKMGAYE